MPGNPLHTRVTADATSFVSEVSDAIDKGEELGDQALTTAGALQVLQGRADEVEDEVDSAGRSATTTAARFGGLTFSTSSLAGALTTLSLATAGTTAAFAALSSTLLPLSVVLGGVVAAAGSLAAVFGGLAATGAATHMEELKSAFAEAKTEIAAIIQPLGEVFGPLLVDAVEALPELVQGIVDSLGPLGQFRESLARMGEFAMQVIPQITGFMFDLAESALPYLNSALSSLSSKASEASGLVSRLSTVFWKVFPGVVDLGKALVDLLGPATRLGTVILTTLLPPLTTAVQLIGDVAGVVTDVATRMRGLPAQIAVTGAAVAALASTAASAVAAIGGLSGVVAGVGAAVAAVTSPLAIAVAAITALAVAWQRNLFNIQDHTRRVLGTVESVIRAGLDRVQTFWKRNGKQIVSTVTSAFNTVRRTIQSALTFIWKNLIGPTLSKIQRAWQRNGRDIMRSASRAFTNVRRIISGAMKFIWGTIIKPYLGYIQAAWNAYGDEILAVTKSAFNLITIVVDTAVSNLLEVIDLFLDVLAGDWEGAWTSIENIVDNTFSGMIALVKGSVSLFKNAIDLVVAAIKFPFEQLYNWLFGGSGALFKDLINDPVGWLKSTGKNLMKGAFSTVTDTIESVLGAISLSGISNTIQGIVQTAKDAIDWLRQVTNFDLSINWPEPPAIVRKAYNGNLNIDWPDPPSDLPDVSNPINGPVIPSGPLLDTGGLVEETGRAVVHEGERVVPAAQVSDRGEVEAGGGTTVVIERIEASGRAEGRAAGRALRDELDALDV